MKLSVSNIAWPTEYDDEMYEFLCSNAINGLEIAPTRLFSSQPYNNLTHVVAFTYRLKEKYNITVSSIQSIWYGVTENIFDSEVNRKMLIDYTKKSIDFACALNCSNIVFGCPKNRNIPADMPSDIYLPIAYAFFRQVGDYAAAHGTCIAIEPNPPIYNTNFINTTAEAFELCKRLNNPGVKVNIDIGTIIHNRESIDSLENHFELINHIHISEPNLVPIEKRELHKTIIKISRTMKYSGFISIEMANQNDIDLIKQSILYVKELL